MGDIIQLLPDNIANQIAAGEVVQRPSNIIKELVENAIDAKASYICVRVKGGGKDYVEVVDDGIGMSGTDARMAFERHATSKIRTIEDIFNIRTMGFRGEALASIGAVAQVVLKTKRAEDEVGTLIEMENSELKRQEPTMCENGTTIIVKNLFFCVPARKHFLKADKKEMGYIVEEFLRIAIPFYDIGFELFDGDKVVYTLPKTNAKNRLLQIYKNYYKEEHLIGFQERYNDFSFSGFLGKPEVARNVRGHQFFFINRRFVKNNYLGHAVSEVYEHVIQKEGFGAYFINIDIDPGTIDINIHPSKQEVKFRDEKMVYSFLHSAIRLAFSKYALIPTLDFDLKGMQNEYDSFNKKPTFDETQKTLSSPIYESFTKPFQAHYISQQDKKDWKSFFEHEEEEKRVLEMGQEKSVESVFLLDKLRKENWLNKVYLQFEKEYIITTYENMLLIIHQQLAHQIILYEKYQTLGESANKVFETLLFPIRIKLSPEDVGVMMELVGYFGDIGYDIKPDKENEFIITSTPKGGSEKEVFTDIEKIIDAYKHLKLDGEFSKKEKLIRCLSLKNSIKTDTILRMEEMQHLAHELFNCQNPFYTYGNLPTMVFVDKHKIDAIF